MTDCETSTIVFDKDEESFVRAVLTSAQENDTDIKRSQDLVRQMMGLDVEFVGGSDEFYEDPPAVSELSRCLTGQRFEGDRTEIEALQTMITVYTLDIDLKAGDRHWELLNLIEGVQDKISEAYYPLVQGMSDD